MVKRKTDDELVPSPHPAEEASRLMREAATQLRSVDGPEAWAYTANRLEDMAGWIEETVEEQKARGNDERGKEEFSIGD